MWSFVGELADNGVEFFESESLIGWGLVVDVGAVLQFKQIVIVDGIVELLSDLLELLEVNYSVLVLIEQSEDSLETVLGLGLAHPWGDDVNELIESDGLGLVPETNDKVQNKGISTIETEFFEDLVDLNWINGSAVILIEDFEGIDQLFVVLGVKPVLPCGGDGLGALAGGGGGFDVALGSAHNILLINNNF